MRALIIFLLISLSLAMQSQGFRVRHYLPNAGTNLSKAIFESSPGNYITGGFVVETQNNQTYNRLCIMGLDAQGQIVWTKKYGRPQFEYLNNNLISRCFYKNGNHMYYAGCVRDSLNNQVGVLIKFDLNGDTLWQKIYRDTQEDVIPQIVTACVDGGFLITGFFQNWTNSTRECLLIKTDANGNELWRKKINKVTPNVNDGQSILQDVISKKIVIVGYQYIGNANSWTIHDNVIVTDSLGDQVNRYDYTGFGGVLKDMIQTSDQKIIAVGYQYDPQTLGGYNLCQSFIVKFDIDNPSQPLWKVQYDKLTLTNVFSCLVELQNGEVLVGGGIDTMQINNLNTNCLARLTKISSTGQVTWSRNYDYKTNSSTSDNTMGMQSINLTSDGSWLAAIECANFPTPNPFFFVKYDSTGCDSTLAYCQNQGTVSGVYKNNFKNLSVELFPNPASDYVSIRLNAFVPGNDPMGKDEVLLLITDVSGREIKRMEITTESTRVDIKDLASGVYMLSLARNKELIYTNKLVKQD